MTRDEFYEKYGNVKVKFSSYYKYTFNYRADLPDGSVLYCGYGGDPGEIYRHDVTSDSEETVALLCPFMGNVVDKEGNEIEGFYDY